MLMESRVEDPDGAANAKKPRSVDLQTLYDQNPKFPITDEKQNQIGSLKRKHGKVDVDSGLEKKKSKKEVLLSNLPSGKKIKKSLDEVYKGGSSSFFSDLNKVESEPSQTDDIANGFDAISLNRGNGIHQIPKRKRDLMHRKKADASNRLKQEGTWGSKVSSSDVAADLNGGSKGKLGQDGEKKGKSDQNGKFELSFGTCVNKKEKRRKGLNDHKENNSSKIDSLLFVDKENLNSHAPSGDPSSNKKAKRNRKTRKETGVKIDAAVKDAKSISHQFTRTHDNSLEDDEENLEENAARMLSSRFDPSCTGFSPNSKCPDSPFANPSDRDDANHDSNLQSKSDVASGDTDVRVLRPRDLCKRKGHFRKRRHFYEVLAKDVDAFWMVQKKIKVYWPLDQIWYFGEVIGYDPKKLLHHIQYDDCEEEWIDLQNERFKLLLFPSELPFKAGRRGSGAGGKHHTKGKSNAKVQDDKCISSHIDSKARGKNHTKGKSNAKVQDDNRISSHTDSEPIISWLSRSTGQIKSSSSGTSKKPKTSNLSGKAHPSSSTLAKGTASDIGSSNKFADKLLSNPALPESSCGGEAGRTSVMERSSTFPVVYFRRRFRRKKHGKGNVSDDKLGSFTEERLVYRIVSDLVDSLVVLPDRSHPTEIFDSSAGDVVSLELPQFGDDLVILKLNTPVVYMEIYRYKLNFLPFLVPYYSFGVENLWIFHALMMLQHGTLMTLWPRVHLEMLFVDNFVGLRFLLFEGCLLQAIAFVFLILNVFHQSNQQRKHADEQLPVTSIRFQFSFSEDAMKRLFFAFYNYCRLETSRWVFLDHMLQKFCSIAKQLPPSECTYNNIKALESGSIHLNMQSGSLVPSSRLGLRRRARQPMTCVSACMNHSHSWLDMDGKWARLPPFAVSFSSAPTFFQSLHLKLLMECSIPCAKFNDGNSISLPENGGVEQVDCCPGECNCNSSLHLCRTNLGGMPRNRPGFDPLSWSGSDPEVGKNVASAGCEDVEIICKPSLQSQVPDDDCLNKCEGKMKPEQRDSSAQPSCPEDIGPPLEGKTTYYPLNGLTVQIPLFNPQERPSNGGANSRQSSVLAMNVTDSAACSRSPTVSRSSWHPSKVGSSLLGNLSHALSEGKPELLCSGPKKPRTQVSYSLPPEGHDATTKFRTHHIKGFSHKCIRRTSEKRESDASKKFQKNMESLSCDLNLLVFAEDRGWRVEGARVVLEPLDDNECQLAVKILESTRYAYKAMQFLQSGTTNRYTHAMIWKGGKEWSLEFPDRSQWTLFKEMHEECYNRNFRAASVKNIPIPGIHLIEENDDNEVELPFVLPSTRYFHQLQTDVDIAMDSSHVLYDMDSDDELWMSKIRSSGSENCGLWNVSDEIFEKIMDKLEKFAYAKQQDHFTPDQLEELVVEGGSLEAIQIVYEHWLEKRQKKGMPLIRHLQPSLWEIYQQLVKEWESAMSKRNRTVSSGFHEKAIEKPPVFAFCLKPRGLELPINRGTKHRSQKKLPVAGHGNMIPADPEAFHSYGRRFYGCASGEEKILYHRGSLDSPPLLCSSTRLLSPRDVGSARYLSLNNDGHERIHYPRLYRTKSRKIGTLLPPNEEQVFPSHNQRIPSKRNGRQPNNTNRPEWSSPRYYHPERLPTFSFEHLDPAELDEFRLRDASSAAQHTVNMANLKREHAQRLLYKADLAIHKAAVAMMTAEAIKASREASTNDSSSDG